MWWDRTIPPGRTFDDVIQEALDAAGCVIAVWTETSVESRWVKTEASEGLKRNVLVPVVLDHVEPPLEFRRIQAADLTGWVPGSSSVEFGNLSAAVCELLPPEIAQHAPPFADGDGRRVLAKGEVAPQHDPRATTGRNELMPDDAVLRRPRMPHISLWWVIAAGVFAVLVVAFFVARVDGGSPTAETGVPATTAASVPATTAASTPSAPQPLEPFLLEAEDGIIAEPMASQADPEALGSMFVSSPEAGNTSDGLGGTVALEFDIEQSGVYEIWGRISVDENSPTSSDSMFVRIDEGPEDVWDFFEENPTYRGWAWDRISMRCGGAFDVHRCNPWLMDLDLGGHVLTVRNRDPGSRLDAVLIAQEGSLDQPPSIAP